jgi:hypothetical protein
MTTQVEALYGKISIVHCTVIQEQDSIQYILGAKVHSKRNTKTDNFDFWSIKEL